MQSNAKNSLGSATPQASGFTVLTFDRPTVSATVQAGYSTTLTADASLTRPSDFTNADRVYVYLSDAVGVIQPDVQFSQTGTYSYRIFMHTVPTLALGSHQGNFEIKVCRDVGCVQQYPGSPMNLPYDITVKAN